MPGKQRTVVDELGIVIAIYLAAMLLYAVFLYVAYGTHPTIDLLETVKAIPKYVKSPKSTETTINIGILVFYVFLHTLPLVISIGIFVYNIEGWTHAQPHHYVISLAICLTIPFVLYYALVDWNVITGIFTRCFEPDIRQRLGFCGHGGQPACAAPSDPSSPAYQAHAALCAHGNNNIFTKLVMVIMSYYFQLYQFPLVVASVSLGGYGGYKVSRLSRQGEVPRLF